MTLKSIFGICVSLELSPADAVVSWGPQILFLCVNQTWSWNCNVSWFLSTLKTWASPFRHPSEYCDSDVRGVFLAVPAIDSLSQRHCRRQAAHSLEIPSLPPMDQLCPSRNSCRANTMASAISGLLPPKQRKPFECLIIFCLRRCSKASFVNPVFTQRPLMNNSFFRCVKPVTCSDKLSTSRTLFHEAGQGQTLNFSR